GESAGERRLLAGAAARRTGTGARAGSRRSAHGGAQLNGGRTTGQLAQHVRENSTTAIVFGFLRGVDAHNGFEGFAGAVERRCDLGARFTGGVDGGGDAFDGEGFLARQN